MVNILSPSGAEQPAGVEQFDVDLYNRNMDKLNNLWIADLKRARGVIGQNINNASNATSGTNTMFDLIAVTLEADRWYRVVYRHGNDSAGSNSAYSLTIKKSATSDATAAGTDIEAGYTLWTADATASGFTKNPEWTWKQTVTETVNVKICAITAVGSATNISSRRMHIYDLGATI